MIHLGSKGEQPSFWARAWSKAFSFRKQTQPPNRSWSPDEALGEHELGPDSPLNSQGALSSPADSRVGPIAIRRDISLLADGATSVTYFVDKPYSKLLKEVRAALKAEGLRIPMEMNVSERIRHELGIDLGRPCLILCVDCPFLLLEAVVVNASAAGFLPLHLVVFDSGLRSIIQVVPPMHGAAPAGLRGQFEKFFGRVLRVLGQVGARTVVQELTL